MSRQKKLLDKWSKTTEGKNYLSRGWTTYDDLPEQLIADLERVKDQETLWSDTERYLGDLATWSSRFGSDRTGGIGRPLNDLTQDEQVKEIKAQLNTMSNDVKRAERHASKMERMNGKDYWQSIFEVSQNMVRVSHESRALESDLDDLIREVRYRNPEKYGSDRNMVATDLTRMAKEVVAMDIGHHHKEGGKWYVDTAFITHIGQKYPGGNVEHMGFGEFSLVTPEGKMEFDRMRGREFEGQVGRSHQIYDNVNGKIVKKAINILERSGKSIEASVKTAKKWDFADYYYAFNQNVWESSGDPKSLAIKFVERFGAEDPELVARVLRQQLGMAELKVKAVKGAQRALGRI